MMNIKLMGLVGVLSLLLCSCAQKKSSPPPNIIIINVDDLGWADLGYTGSKFYESPNIDELAKQGMVFTQAYASASNCAPSRACMITGLNTPRHGIYTVSPSERGLSTDRKLIPIKTKDTLHDSLTTLAEILNVFGYTTCQAGKWHLSKDSRDHGFDFNIGGSHAGHPHSYYPPYKNVKLGLEDSLYLTDKIMNRVLEFLDERQDDLIFLYYAPYAVHTPIHQVDSLIYKFEDKKGPSGMNNVKYATMINNLDRNIGRLISKLKELNLYENSLIIFSSDNGGLYRISKQKPLRAGKGSYYEGGIRVPTFFVWKDRISAGKISSVPIVNMDFFPTIANIIGADISEKKMDGIDLSPLLLENKEPDERTFYWHFPIYLEGGNEDTRDSIFRTRPGSAIRFGDWKLQEYFEDDFLELYNLESDPGELNNLANTRPDKLEELQHMLKMWREEVRAPLPFELNPEYIENKN
jgi:arylsulfatase A-like enzyme